MKRMRSRHLLCISAFNRIPNGCSYTAVKMLLNGTSDRECTYHSTMCDINQQPSNVVIIRNLFGLNCYKGCTRVMNGVFSIHSGSLSLYSFSIVVSQQDIVDSSTLFFITSDGIDASLMGNWSSLGSYELLSADLHCYWVQESSASVKSICVTH